MTTDEEARAYARDKDAEKIMERMKASGVTFDQFTRAFDSLHPEHKPNVPIPSHFNESEWKAVIDQIRRSGESLSSAADDAAHQKKLTQDLEPRSGQTVPVGQDKGASKPSGTSPNPHEGRSTGGRIGSMFLSFEGEEEFQFWAKQNINVKILSTNWDEVTHRLVVKIEINDYQTLTINDDRGYLPDERTSSKSTPIEEPIDDKYPGLAKQTREKHFNA